MKTTSQEPTAERLGAAGFLLKSAVNPLNQVRLCEKEPGFTLSILIRIRRVNCVPFLRLGEELPDRAWLRLDRVGGADRFSEGGDCVGAFEDHRHALARSHESDKRGEERT